MKATKVGSTATVIRNSVLINPILPFGIVACTFFPDNLSRNSCMMYNIGLRSSRHQRNLYQEVYSPPHNHSAIIYTVYLPGIFTSSSSPNISLLILIDSLRRTSKLICITREVSFV